MDRGTISGRYAKALFRYAQKHGVEKEVYGYAITLGESFAQYPALKRILGDPISPGAKKGELIRLCAGGNVNEEFLRFIQLLIRQKREDLLQLICLNYLDFYLRDQQILHVDIDTAIPLEEDLRQRIVHELEQLTNKTVHLNARVDPGIIGGYVIRWDTYRLDTSVATRLKEIKKNLIRLGS